MRPAARRLLSTLALLLLAATDAYRKGFSMDQCDSMDPEIHTANGDATEHGNLTDEEPLELSTSPLPYVVTTSMANYKRARTMQIFIHGENISALLLQMREYSDEEDSRPVRVGEFKSWPHSIRPLRCDEDKVSALTNTDLSPKANITVSWQAPPEDVGKIQILGTFIHDGMYWLMAEGPTLNCDDFPVSLSSCGKEKSCFLHSEKPSCHADSCDYIVTYKAVDNNRSVEFVLGGYTKHDNCYLGIGFSQDKEVSNMSFIACSKSEGATEVKYYIVQSRNDPPVEQSMPFEEVKIDTDDDRLWCTFTVPLMTPGESLDLSIPQFHVYLFGHMKDEVPALPQSENMLMSKQEMSIEELTLTHHVTENSAPHGFCTSTMLLICAAFTIFSYL